MTTNIHTDQVETLSKRIDRLQSAYWRTQDRIDALRYEHGFDREMEELYWRSERLSDLAHRCQRRMAVALILAAEFDRRFA